MHSFRSALRRAQRSPPAYWRSRQPYRLRPAPSRACSPARPAFEDLDARTGRVTPTAAQTSEVASLGARAVWNRYGTPASLIAGDGFLTGASAGSPADVARSFVRDHRELFRLSAADVDALDLVNDAKLAGSGGHAVLFRQRFGSLPAGHGGMITVGVSGGRVAYVSSSAAGSQAAPAAADAQPRRGLAARGRQRRRPRRRHRRDRRADPRRLDGVRCQGPRHADRPGQQAGRSALGLVAFPTFTQGVRPAFETIVLDADGGDVRAYRSFVDARTGEVLFRSNEVKQAADGENGTGTFTGSTADGANGCGNPHPVAVTGAYSIGAFATANLPSDDIVLRLIGPGGSAVASSDTATARRRSTTRTTERRSPTGRTRSSSASSTIRRSRPAATRSATPAATSINTAAGTPACRQHPRGSTPQRPAGDNRVAAASCSRRLRLGLNNTASRGPWDMEPADRRADVHHSGQQRPHRGGGDVTAHPRPVRLHADVAHPCVRVPFENQWAQTKCDPTPLAVPGSGADVSAAVTNLFAGHNRIHDYSYFLGFTETNYNTQRQQLRQHAPGPYPSGGATRRSATCRPAR